MSCWTWSIGSSEETAKFDFAGVHAANIEAFFYRNDGLAAERVADVLIGMRSVRAGHSSRCPAHSGARGRTHRSARSPRAPPAWRSDRLRPKSCAPGSVLPGATSGSSLPSSRRCLSGSPFMTGATPRSLPRRARDARGPACRLPASSSNDVPCEHDRFVRYHPDHHACGVPDPVLDSCGATAA